MYVHWPWGRALQEPLDTSTMNEAIRVFPHITGFLTEWTPLFFSRWDFNLLGIYSVVNNGLDGILNNENYYSIICLYYQVSVFFPIEPTGTGRQVGWKYTIGACTWSMKPKCVASGQGCPYQAGPCVTNWLPFVTRLIEFVAPANFVELQMVVTQKMHSRISWDKNVSTVVNA